MNKTEKLSLKMAGLFIFAYVVSSEILDIFIFLAFPSGDREVTFLAATILFSSSLLESITSIMIYLIMMSAFTIFIAWLIRKFHPDFHLRQQATSRWFALGIIVGLSEFQEMWKSGIYTVGFIFLVIILYWLAFLRFAPQPD